MDNLQAILIEAINEKKAIDPVVLDLTNISGVTDYFIICSGNSTVQVRAIADNIIDKYKETVNQSEITLPNREGYNDGRWILIDFGHIVVHVMHQDEREFYALEKLWHDAKITKF
ncbi:MAG TPA: ribosome silencing factor [Bacillota bacterium]|jgi:ribosome-associated protein|nr:ribosome silencing factor [Bacillota bacterium]HOL09224.1 ribosome silencing factor [Bacillota bacterium]HPO97048.1 ribosome silencing factor [Bacillota bacterium]